MTEDLESAPAQVMTALRDPLAFARAAKERAPVVGFLSNNVPVELIHAAGCFPLQLPAARLEAFPQVLTAPRQEPRTRRRADRYMERAFDPMARSVFEGILGGDFDFVDLIVLPRTVDSFQRLYYYLCELRRTGLERVPESYLYDLLHTPWYTSAEYNHARTVDLAERLQILTGRMLAPGDLGASIALYNRIRRRLSRIFERRCAVPCQLAGAEALALYVAAQQMHPEAFERVLDGILALPPRIAPGKRILLVGAAHDTPALHASIARAGGQVVADYHWRGELLFGCPIDEGLPPLRALSGHYHRDSWSVRRFPSSVEDLLDVARCARVEGTIFYYYEQDEALPWDCPAQARALAGIGVPSLRLDSQPYPADGSSDGAIRQFIADLPSAAA